MNHNDREHFWQTLCSLPGNDIVAEREQLFKAIKYPKQLFRYRPVSTKSLDALRTNKLYFSSIVLVCSASVILTSQAI